MRKVHPGVSLAWNFQAEKAMSKKTMKPVTLKEVEAIGMLPKALQRKIHVELCMRHLEHPLLRWWTLIDPKGVQGLCHSAIDFVGLAAEDHLFFPRTSAGGAYVMTSGVGTYHVETQGR